MYTPFELFAPTSLFYDPREDLYNRRAAYLAAKQEAERRRRYQEALAEQAYMQELERIRRQRAIEEEVERKRQAEILYRKELERRRRMEQERNKRRAVAALQAYEKQQRQEQERRRMRSNNTRREPLPEYQLLQGPDGRIYRVKINPNSFIDSLYHDDGIEMSSENMIPVSTSNAYSTDASNHTSSSSSLEEDEQMDVLPSKHTTSTPMFQNVVFNNCFNENLASETKVDDEQVAKTNKFSSKKSMKKTKKKMNNRSSILIGGVEDASDSEYEDEFKDFWHNRRPEKSWIEPVEFFNLKSSSK